MTEDLTHKVRIVVTGRYPHGDSEHAEVVIAGNGDLYHMQEAFAAALVAAGFSTQEAQRVRSLGKAD